MVALGGAGGHEGGRARFKRLAAGPLKLADLVATASEAGEVVALDPQVVGAEAQGAGQPGHGFDGGRPTAEQRPAGVRPIPSSPTPSAPPLLRSALAARTSGIDSPRSSGSRRDHRATRAARWVAGTRPGAGTVMSLPYGAGRGAVNPADARLAAQDQPRAAPAGPGAPPGAGASRSGPARGPPDGPGRVRSRHARCAEGSAAARGRAAVGGAARAGLAVRDAPGADHAGRIRRWRWSRSRCGREIWPTGPRRSPTTGRRLGPAPSAGCSPRCSSAAGCCWR